MATIPSIAMIPSGYKAGKLYSVLPTNGDGDFTTTRNSVATRVNENGLIEEVASNVPRLDYSDSGCPSLFLEPTATNLITYSEDFSQSVWAKNSVGSASSPVVTLNYATSPDGTQNASRLQLEVSGSSSSDKSFLENTQTLDGSSTYTLTFYIKSNNGVNQNLIFLKNSVSGNAITATNEWVRVEQAFSSDSTFNRGFGLMALGNIQQSVDVIIWGAQLEQQSYVSSYIKTAGTVQTRVADTASKTGVTNLIGQTEGVLFVDFKFKGLPNNVSSMPISINGSGSNEAYIYIDVNNTVYGQFVVGGSFTCDISGDALILGNTYKIAFAYKNSDFALFVNGVLSNSSNSGAVGANQNIVIGNYLNGNYTHDNIKDLKIYNTRLSNAELQALTTI